MRIAVTAVLSALVGFGIGRWIAPNRGTSPPASAARSVPSAAFNPLVEEHRRLEAERQRLSSEVDRLDLANATLIAARADRAPAPTGETDGTLGVPLQRHEIQEKVLSNFRLLAAAQDQYKLEHGHWPSSLGDLIGPSNYIRRMLTVDGEDYANLQWGGRTFRLTTRSGVKVAYANDEPVDTSSSEFRVEYPPEVTRARELEEKTADARQAATAAYSLANRGKSPPNERALIAFFANPAEGADFVEYLEAKKALPED